MKLQLKTLVQRLAHNYLSLGVCKCLLPHAFNNKTNQTATILYRDTILAYLHSYHFQCNKRKVMTSYSNMYACNRFCPLGYFIFQRISSSTQPRANLPHSKKTKLMWANLPGRCKLAAGADTGTILGTRRLRLLCTPDV